MGVVSDQWMLPWRQRVKNIPAVFLGSAQADNAAAIAGILR